MRAVFVVDVKSGQGHLVRSRALMAELASRGWRCSMVSKPVGAVASHDVTIFDGPAFDREEAYEAASGKPVVAIVDTPGARHVDLTVCGSAGAKPDMFQCSGCVKTHGYPPVAVCAGPQYALLRHEFATLRSWILSDGVHTTQHGVLDIRNIKDIPADRLASMLMNAEVVITYAGMRAMEAACIGVPSALLIRNEGELLNATGLIAGGAAISGSTWTDALLAQAALLKSMSETGRALVDGLGCQRVADAIERMLG